MEEYLITARSVTHAQRMAQALERKGLHAVVARAPMGLTGRGCGYVLRLRGREKAAAAWGLLREMGFSPAQVFQRWDDGYSEVELWSILTRERLRSRSRMRCGGPCTRR